MLDEAIVTHKSVNVNNKSLRTGQYVDLKSEQSVISLLNHAATIATVAGSVKAPQGFGGRFLSPAERLIWNPPPIEAGDICDIVIVLLSALCSRTLHIAVCGSGGVSLALIVKLFALAESQFTFYPFS